VLLVYQPAALKRMHTQLMSSQSWLDPSTVQVGGASFFTAGWQLAEISSLSRAARLTSLPPRRSVSKRPCDLQWPPRGTHLVVFPLLLQRRRHSRA